MQCPRCGGNNFGFARRCDHCGAELGRASAPEYPVGGEFLDLRRHAPDDVPGKTIVVNGTSYTILGRSRSAPDADVYPLRHQRSRLVTFELKVFRSTPDSSGSGRARQLAIDGFRRKAALSTESDPAARDLVVEEVYEQSGGLIGLFRTAKLHPGPAYDVAGMRRARDFVKAGKAIEAVQALDRVLAANPHHIPALGNKAVLFAQMGDVPAAVAMFWRCIDIDRNQIEAYHNAAAFLAGGGRPEPAMRILRKALERCGEDFATWMLLIEIATTCDALDMVEDLVERGLSAIPGTPAAQLVCPLLEQSRERWRRYGAALDQAVEEQLSRRWDEALGLLDQCRTLTKRNALAELNRGICLFQKHDVAAAVEVLRACFHRLEGTHGLSAYLMVLLGSADAGQWETAKAIACDLNRQTPDPLHLPRIPVAAKYAASGAGDPVLVGGTCVEELPVDRIVAVLDLLPLRASCSAAEGEALRVLRGKYQYLGATKLPLRAAPPVADASIPPVVH